MYVYEYIAEQAILMINLCNFSLKRLEKYTGKYSAINFSLSLYVVLRSVIVYNTQSINLFITHSKN